MLIHICFVATIASHLVSIALCSPFGVPSIEDKKIFKTRALANFTHPGVFLSSAQLQFIKSKVSYGAQPWTDAYNDMLNSRLGSLTRSPSPSVTVECGFTSTPDKGCTEEKQDALAAYAMSLAWYISGSVQYAQKAIAYMNAWAQTIQAHTNNNAPLQTGWAGASWARAAEIIRYTNAGWASSDITAFENMLRTVYLPTVIVGSNYNGNWELVMMEAAVGISVFLNDGASYTKAMTKYLSRVPAYIYLTTDGSCPKAAPGSGLTTCAQIESYWQGQTTFPENGIAQETCRDLAHTGYGITSISHIAETSRIQGQDLYPTDIGTRLRYALGFHSKLELGNPVPSYLCHGSVKKGLGPITEVGYNALSTRLGYTMPNTKILTDNNRPAGTNLLFVGWETLTHAGNTA